MTLFLLDQSERQLQNHKSQMVRMITEAIKTDGTVIARILNLTANNEQLRK